MGILGKRPPRAGEGEVSGWARVSSRVAQARRRVLQGVARDSASQRYYRLFEIGNTASRSITLAMTHNPEAVSRLVVLETLPRSAAADPRALARLLFEARLMARLSHPNVVAVHALCFDGRKPVLALEYLDGVSLATLLGGGSAPPELSVALRVGIVCRILRGLQYVHELRDFDGRRLPVVHGAVCPSNVMITYHGAVKLIDFSQATLRPQPAEPAFIDSNFPYLAPERVRGTPDPLADVFAAGVVLWELLAQAPLWGQTPAPIALRRLLAGSVPRLREARPDCDPELERICSKAMAVHPGDRYESAAAMCEVLERFLASQAWHVTDAAIGSMLSLACGEQRRRREEALAARLIELGLEPSDRRPRSDRHASGSGLLEGGATPRALALGAAIVGAAVLGAGAVVGHAGDPAAPALGTARRALQVSAREASGEANAELVALEIAMQPREATLYLDGQRLTSNPTLASMVRDARSHTIRGEAAGFHPFSQTFSLDVDVAIEAALEPVVNDRRLACTHGTDAHACTPGSRKESP
jgi:serine/threonine-protein kinase